MATKIVKARILLALSAFSIDLKPNDVVSGTEKQIDTLVKQGAADKHPDAVAAGLKANGNQVTDIAGAVAAAELAEEIAQAEEALKSANELLAAAKTDEEKSAAQKKVDDAAAALEALKK